MQKYLFWLALSVLTGATASAQDLPHGIIVDDVQCLQDESQHYALYLPSNFTERRHWPVILGFDAGGRGRRAVERYQAAAEKYGWIVVGSNNSRNGPWEPSLRAASAMSRDVESRFPINPARTYTAGMSGGARVAMTLALDFPDIAGVFASSAGFPDDFQESVRFPIFGSMGTDDFNHYEMYVLDRDLKSPHRVEMFDGGHQWLPVEMATDGVEWMEIQAMKSGLRPRDQELIDQVFAKRTARADAQTSSLLKMRELKSIADDFQGFKDVADLSQRAASLEGQQGVKDELKAERAEGEREVQVTREVFQLRSQLTPTSNGVFAKLKDRVTALLAESKAADDSSTRRIARRVLASLGSSSRDTPNPKFQELLKQIRPPGQPGGPE